jgi:hypothetical protein
MKKGRNLCISIEVMQVDRCKVWPDVSQIHDAMRFFDSQLALPLP